MAGAPGQQHPDCFRGAGVFIRGTGLSATHRSLSSHGAGNKGGHVENGTWEVRGHARQASQELWRWDEKGVGCQGKGNPRRGREGGMHEDQGSQRC